ncbi:unnamed protein product [Psylliodes chrysocephalus]|uniref:non-specific serine/threonine protein kinase n=1 Tax=Psylliodes chrysocephalus TaxID=3402493 RepID=A0A9P0CH67_9CUCU|nr:unnamed protein product [Psylliodes chrysocephala]
MDKYEVIGTLGEGSFGRVYKAKQLSTGILVALKVISKRGRSAKELKGFKRECEIQRDLHHPNIIQMLDSFETENEIVVITEFAHKELTTVLGKVGYLPEEKVQTIVWDLVSALYYLHSNRVLHRDLKPQNILLDVNNVAKLCDFGFARNMSTGTHVLTSIKGTPLYMAPELIDEKPYDYTADLWSLGCIIYELLMGSPPFCTSSILHLIRLIRHEQIQWNNLATFLSASCISFLKGLLQKNPAKRMTWNEILVHPFVKGHINITKNVSLQPLTRSLSPNTSHAKEQQRKESMKNKLVKTSAKSNDIPEHTLNKPPVAKTSKHSLNSSDQQQKSENQDLENNNLEEAANLKEASTSNTKSLAASMQNLKMNSSKNAETVTQKSEEKSPIRTFTFIEDNQPIETEEWIVFLTRTIQEVMNGEMVSLTESSQANVLVSPLRNPNASSRVLSFVVRLLSIPFVIKGVSQECLVKIRKVYLEVKLIPNLVYASKLLLRECREDSSTDTSSPINSPLPLNVERYRKFSELNDEDLQALEQIFLLIAHLVHVDDDFLIQFCDSVVVLSVYLLMKLVLSLTNKSKNRIVADVLAILTRLMKQLPENGEVIEKILLLESDHPDINPVDLVDLLRHSDSLLRERSCYFLLWISKTQKIEVMKILWSFKVKDTLEALMYDSMEAVRNAAEYTVMELKTKEYYREVK